MSRESYLIGDIVAISGKACKGEIIDKYLKDHDIIYTVKWDTMKHNQFHSHRDVEHRWILISSPQDTIKQMQEESLQKIADAYVMNHDDLEEKPCNHLWKLYDSGWTQFEYCASCDIKKEDLNEKENDLRQSNA